MSTPNIRLSLLTLSIAQAFSFSSVAIAQSVEKTLPEVIVTPTEQFGSRSGRASVGGFSDAPLLQTPASISVYDQQQLQDRQIRQTTDLVKFDASLNEAYNAIGYAEQFSIRGYTLDNSTSYRKDGLPISSDASIPLENKERIEVLKGLAGLQAGIATPGGVLNYVTKRPTSAPLRLATVGVSERGTLYSAIDVGGRLDGDKRFGYRINAAAEKLRSYVEGADGERYFVSGAFDWRLTPQALLQLDLDYQHKSQLSVPGFQLLNGTALPTGIAADTMLNNYSWSKPVKTDSGNIGLRFDYQFDADWRATLSANQYQIKRDDFAAFPYGCTTGNLFPGFCGNGEYDVYDYQSENESKSQTAAQALLQGNVTTGALRHELTFGISGARRRDKAGDFVYDFRGTDNLYGRTTGLTGSALKTGPVGLRRKEIEQSLFAQDILSLSDKVKLHAGLRHTKIERDQLNSSAAVIGRYDRSYLLPNVALVFNPVSNWTLYGSYSEGLEHGGTAPLGTANQNLILDPSKSRQVEFGVKTELANDLTMSAALFHIKKPNEYTEFSSNTYLRRGDAVHRGLELSLQGRATRDLMLGTSISILDTETKNTGDPAIEGKRAANAPDLRSSVYADYALRQMPGLSLNGSWQYTGSKVFGPVSTTRVKVPDYHLFNAGARYVTRVAGQTTTLRFNVDNVFDKFYWRDATNLLGGYLLPGAPRTFRVTAQFEF